MPDTPARPSQESVKQPSPQATTDTFFLDGLADTTNPEFTLEPDECPAAEQAAIQTELQLSLDNPETAHIDSQLEFDGMAKPIFAIHLETGTAVTQQLHFQNAPTLLESLEAQNIQVPYQCRDGYCGACRCKKISGEVNYTKEPMAWINDDEILPCVSIPTSDLKLKLKGWAAFYLAPSLYVT